MDKSYEEYNREELEDLCVKRHLISESETGAFTEKHLIELLEKADSRGDLTEDERQIRKMANIQGIDPAEIPEWVMKAMSQAIRYGRLQGERGLSKNGDRI
jgi:Zn-dependent M32 family carboxypeptidase